MTDSVRWAAEALRSRYGVPSRPAPQPVLDGLMGTVLSQHTTGATARQAHRTLKERFPDIGALPEADPEEIAAAIRVAGLAATRARRLQAIVAQVRHDWGEASLETLRELPDHEVAAYLTALPGVGPKTAACVLLFALGRDVFPVDTHVWRLAKRLGWVTGSAGRNATFDVLADAVPAALRHELHVNLLRHGRAVCRAQRPLCDDCPLASRCPSRLSAP